MEEMNVELRCRDYHRRETIAFSSNGVTGDVYRVGDAAYIRTRSGVVFTDVAPSVRSVAVRDPAILRAVEAQVEGDRAISAARDAHAEALAHSDALLAEVLRWHMEFTSGHVERYQTVRNGITFYQVGRNASHMFFIGAKDGQRYVLAIGEEGCDEEHDEPVMAEHIRAVDDWYKCYLGHF